MGAWLKSLKVTLPMFVLGSLASVTQAMNSNSPLGYPRDIGWLTTAPNPWLLVSAAVSGLGFVASLLTFFQPKPYTPEQGREDRKHQNRTIAVLDERIGQGQEQIRQEVIELKKVIVAVPGSTASQDLWLDPSSAEPLMDSALPPVGSSPREIEAKAQLYGGKPGLDCTSLDFVALGHTFDRENVRELAERIRANEQPCSSFALAAERGTGLSLALAQLVRDFSLDDRAEVISVIGDPGRTLRLIHALESRTDHFIAWSKSLAPDKDRVLVVIDDVWGDRSFPDIKLMHFRNRCCRAFEEMERPKLTFVFGVFGAGATLAEELPVSLKLTGADRAACYAKMAVAEPTIMAGYGGGPPPEARQIGNDAQAFIDFHLQHGGAYQTTKENWLGRIDDLETPQRDILAIIATAALLDLAMPERAALALVKARNIPGLTYAEDMIAANDRLTLGISNGRVIALSCPWRARSILQRSGRYGLDLLIPSFKELLHTALDEHEKLRKDAAQHLDFARHVFQRLGKREYYPIRNADDDEDWKDPIGRVLLSESLDRLRALSVGWDVADRAKWAGTMSRWVDGPDGWRAEPESERQLRQSCAEFVIELGEHCIDGAALHGTPLTPPMALSLLRASRRVLSAGLFSSAGISHRFANCLDDRLSQIGILSLVRTQIDHESQSDDLSYRVNELLTAYCQFKAVLKARTPRERNNPEAWLCRDMTALMCDAERLIALYGIAFDAGAWIERARFVWVDEKNPERREWALRRRHDFLQTAQQCVEANPVAQGTWLARVKSARIKLRASFPPADHDRQ